MGRRTTDLPSQTLRSRLLDRPHQPHRASNSLSHTSTRCARLWFPGKGIRNMTPGGPGLFYLINLQTSLVWWKTPQNFASKKLPVSLDRAWSQGRVPKGSSLSTEIFGTEIRRPTRCGFRDSRSSQGPTDWGVSRPCSGGRTLPLQITDSHTSG